MVQAGIYDKFVEKATARANARKVGNPFESVEQGPQVDEAQLKTVKLLNFPQTDLRLIIAL